MTRMVQCVKLKREAEGLPAPPYPGELGVRIWQNVSKEAWEMKTGSISRISGHANIWRSKWKGFFSKMSMLKHKALCRLRSN